MSSAERKPYLSLYGAQKCLSITRYDLELLGEPKYICLYRNRKKDSIAVGSCDEKHVMSFKVPENLKKGERLRIHSKSFLETMMEYNSMDKVHSYRVEGEYMQDKNMLIFNLKNAWQTDRDGDSVDQEGSGNEQ